MKVDFLIWAETKRSEPQEGGSIVQRRDAGKESFPGGKVL